MDTESSKAEEDIFEFMTASETEKSKNLAIFSEQESFDKDIVVDTNNNLVDFDHKNNENICNNIVLDENNGFMDFKSAKASRTLNDSVVEESESK